MKFIYVIMFLHLVSLSAQTLNFHNLSVTDGLPDNRVRVVIQDSNGFIWFGTQNGLSRYDGYEFREFRNDPGNPHSLSNNGIWFLLESKLGYIWIGTQNGDLNRYDPQKNLFAHWSIGSKDEENYISSLYEDDNFNIWVGTYNKGLYRFDPSGNKLEHWLHNSEDINSLSNDLVNSIVPDNEGNLWIGTYSGLNKFNPEKNNQQFEKYFADKSNPNSLTNDLIWYISRSKFNPDIFYIGTYEGVTILNSKTQTFEKLLPLKNSSNQFSNSIGSIIEKITSNGIELWFGSYGGFIKYNLLTKQTEQWHHNHNVPGNLVSNQINDLLMDRSGVIWIATEDGVSCLSEKKLRFNNDPLQKLNADDHRIIDGLEIRAIAETEDGIIFLGTSNGLKYFLADKNGSKLASVQQFDSFNIWSLAAGRNNDLWVGTYGKGLFNFNLKSSEVKRISFQSPTDRNIPYNYVKTIYEDENGKLWVGFWGGGLAITNSHRENAGTTINQKIFRKDLNKHSSISFNDIWKIYQDNFGRIWIGTNGGGLNLYDDKRGDAFFRISGVNRKEIPNNILSICEQKNSRLSNKVTVLWLGTTEGLTKLEIKNTYTFNNINDIILYSENYTTENGLANNVISEIVEDRDGNLWLTTNIGLSLFNTEQGKFTNFTFHDGLVSNSFSSGALLKTRDGFIFAGGNQGLNIFQPDGIKLSDFQPQIVFTDFLILNKHVAVSEDSPLKKEISYTKEIMLNYDQNTFSIYFSSLDFNAPQLIDYTYLLEGFDKEWNLQKKHNYASYTNLDPGKYIFKVKATNSDKVWVDSAAEMLIIINPPWWKTTWSYIVYISLILSGFFAIRKFQINRAELRNELKMHEFEAKKHQELENLKSRFFANLSHEFRTPLMLIKGPIEQLVNTYANPADLAKISGQKPEQTELAEQLMMIRRNSRKLQKLIDQLLELSQLEAASIPLKAKKENLIVLLCGIVSSFESFAYQKDIKLIFDSKEDKLFVWVDRDKFEKIINNLLSNSFKFTETGGTVSVFINKNTQQAEIKISDTGIGIPNDQIEKIFDRFYQADNSTHRAIGGSGIGLSLVKELVDLHKWKISVESKPGKGTEFTLLIPQGDLYLDENEKIYEKNPDADLIKLNVQLPEGINGVNPEKDKVQNDSSEKSLVLIVEDSQDIRKFISGLLKPCYNLIEAENGEEGLKTAVEKMPDLIISDIMMPYMDGIEFCRRIKINWETSHIPVILLTAKASAESKIEGLETGADDYLTKPFDSKELFIRVKNLLEQRQRLKDKFSKEIKISAEAVTTTSLDNEFLNKAFVIVEKNLANSDFDTEAFAKEMFVSRSQLHRKLLAITGLPPGEFLKSFRLKRAAQMLLEKRFSITQIALEVGFNNPSYFTKSFRQQFGSLPSEFAAKV